MVAEPVRFWTRERKVGTGLVVAGVAAAIGFGTLATDVTARFTLTEDPAGASIGINGVVGAVLFGILCALAGVGMAVAPRRWFSLLLGLGIVATVLSFLCWQISTAPTGLTFMPLTDVV